MTGCPKKMIAVTKNRCERRVLRQSPRREKVARRAPDEGRRIHREYSKASNRPLARVCESVGLKKRPASRSLAEGRERVRVRVQDENQRAVQPRRRAHRFAQSSSGAIDASRLLPSAVRR